MLNQVNQSIRRSSRLLTLKHPNSVDVSLYRKIVSRDEPETLGGALVLSSRDEADYEIELQGAGRMLFLGKVDGSNHNDWGGLNYSGNEVTAYIEPIIEGEFTPQKHDRVYWHLAQMAIEYEVVGVMSPSQFPDSRLSVYVLQPLEVLTDDTEL